VKLALYHPWIYLKSGVERSFVELLERSRHDWVLLTHHHEPDATYPELRAADIRQLHPAVSVRRSLVPLARGAATIARSRLPLGGAQALLVSSEGFGDLVAPRAGVPVVAYCHTPLKILHDPATRAALVGGSRLRRTALGAVGAAFEQVDRRAWRSYRHVFANSHETARRIETARLLPSGPVEVLHPGVDLNRFPAGPLTGRDPFVLVAGRIMWQKHIELAIDAVAELRRRGQPARLVVAGAVDVKSRPYLAQLRSAADGLDVEFVIDPDDAALGALYRSCSAVLFTARNEDFGIVPLEAMASGALVLAVDAGGPRETVVHDQTGWLLPRDVVSFADRVAAVLAAGDALVPMREAAVRRAAEFGWDHFTRRIDDVMGEVAGG
jgi:glycosyltransferase involved in cell wall biosynthesis